MLVFRGVSPFLLIAEDIVVINGLVMILIFQTVAMVTNKSSHKLTTKFQMFQIP